MSIFRNLRRFVLWNTLSAGSSVHYINCQKGPRVSICPDSPSAPDVEGSMPAAAKPQEPGRVLVALTPDRTAAAALQEAHDFAQRLGAELHVIRVVSHADGDFRGPPRDLAQAVRESHRVLAAARRARKICDRVLKEHLSGARICVRLGNLVDQVAQRAAELDAQLIAVPSGAKHVASLVMDLARRADCAVLVPKGCTTFGTLLAATDLEDARIPVLRKAVQLGRVLGAPVVGVHSVVNATSEDCAGVERSRQRLEAAAQNFHSGLDPIVLWARDPVGGILAQARARNAALIVVGVRVARRRSTPSTAAQLITRSRRSILVQPLDVPWQSRSSSAAS